MPLFDFLCCFGDLLPHIDTEVGRYCRAGLFGSIGIGHANSSPWAVSWLVYALSTPDGGEGYNSSTDIDPYYNHINTAPCIQAASSHLAEKITGKPQPKYCMYKSSPYQRP
jgi:hypothetical protein